MAAAVIEINVDPFIDVGPIEIAWHGLTTAFGILLAAFIAIRYARRRGMETEPLTTVLIWAALAGMVGAKLLFLIETDVGGLLDPAA
jgi:phosphatidylglycerol:prolipoprotein diacylglycerol transferase